MPSRRVMGGLRAALESPYSRRQALNLLYGMANLVRGQVTARITPASWWANMKSGWVWDLDDFVANQIGHPLQGSNCFNAGRANGLTFYESAGIRRLRQRHVGIFRRDQPALAQRLHQHDVRGNRAGAR